jgi:hypothetical protein
MPMALAERRVWCVGLGILSPALASAEQPDGVSSAASPDALNAAAAGAFYPVEFIPLSFWYDAPLTSQYSDRRHNPYQVYGSPIYSPARWSSWISPA